MPSPVQAALDRASAALQRLFPGQVQLAALPGENLAANVGAFRRQRVQQDTGYAWIEFGQVVIRRAVLDAANVTTPPASGDKLIVHGREFRVQFVTPDSTGYTLDCMNVS